MLSKLFRSIAIGLVVGGLLLAVIPSLRQFNKLSAPQFDSADETPATYNQAVRRAAGIELSAALARELETVQVPKYATDEYSCRRVPGVDSSEVR